MLPAYRAAAALPRVLARVRSAVPAAAVFVVDDGSDDGGGTADAAAASGAVVLRHGGNLGKGRALATGLAAAVGSGAPVVVTLDADGQHPPEAIPLLVEPVRQGRADLVVGARERGGPMPLGRRITNRLSSALVSRALGVRVPDSLSGFRAMRRAGAGRVRPAGARYEFETEFLFLAARHGYRIAAVRIPTVYEGARSHFRYGADTLAVAAVLLRHWQPILAGGAAKP